MTPPPRAIMALALVTAGALVVMAVFVAVLTISEDDFFDLNLVNRVQLAMQVVSLPATLLVPLALLLVDRDDDPPTHGLARMAVAVAAGVAGAFVVLLVLRLAADLVGEPAFSATSDRFGAFLYDLAALVVAVAGAWWAVRLLQPVPSAPPPPGPPTRPWPAPPPAPPPFPPQQQFGQWGRPG